jgi:hypothetical protein
MALANRMHDIENKLVMMQNKGDQKLNRIVKKIDQLASSSMIVNLKISIS